VQETPCSRLNRAMRGWTVPPRKHQMELERRLRAVTKRREPAVTTRRKSRAPRRLRRLRAAAFHEAGHAVAAYHLHVRLRRISIGANKDDALGWLDLWLPHAASGDADTIRQARAVERDVIVLLAGAQAERVGLGRSSFQTGGVDFYEAMRRAGAICHTSAEISAYLRWLQLRTHALVQSQTWRQPIGTLAARLLECRQLGARETRAIIRAAVSNAQSTASIPSGDSRARHQSKSTPLPSGRGRHEK
jgi:ATP-dependent Zn protease